MCGFKFVSVCVADGTVCSCDHVCVRVCVWVCFIFVAVFVQIAFVTQSLFYNGPLKFAVGLAQHGHTDVY